MSLDRAALLRPRLEEDDVPVGKLGTVRVRALSRKEAADLNDLTDTLAREAFIVATGMVDPVMTKADVLDWQAAAPAGELDPIALRIGELSGLLESSEKDAYKSDGDGSGA